MHNKPLAILLLSSLLLFGCSILDDEKQKIRIPVLVDDKDTILKLARAIVPESSATFELIKFDINLELHPLSQAYGYLEITDNAKMYIPMYETELSEKELRYEGLQGIARRINRELYPNGIVSCSRNHPRPFQQLKEQVLEHESVGKMRHYLTINSDKIVLNSAK